MNLTQMKRNVDKSFGSSNPLVGLLISAGLLFLVKKFPALAGIIALAGAALLAYWALNGGIDFASLLNLTPTQ